MVVVGAWTKCSQHVPNAEAPASSKRKVRILIVRSGWIGSVRWIDTVWSRKQEPGGYLSLSL